MSNWRATAGPFRSRLQIATPASSAAPSDATTLWSEMSTLLATSCASLLKYPSMASSATRRLATSPTRRAGGGPFCSIAAARTAATWASGVKVISALVLYFAPGGGSSSVLYSGVSALDLAMKAARAAASSGGGASVRVATGWPTRVKNFSCPEGAHIHSNRDGVSAALVNECGALAGTLMVSPARATSVSPRKVTWTSPSSTVNISSKSCRCGGGPPPGGTCMSISVYFPAVSSPVTRIV